MASAGSSTAFHVLPQRIRSNSPVSLIPRSIAIEGQEKPGKEDEDMKAKATGSGDLAVPKLIRPSKRSSSSSNDLQYERDRFRARLQTLNTANSDGGIFYGDTKEEGEESDEGESKDENECEVCDGIVGTKTAKLNVISTEDTQTAHYTMEEEISPFDSNSIFYKEYLPLVPLFQNTHDRIIIKSTTYDQLRIVFQWYFSRPLPPTKEMFPWLHGLHRENFAQRLYFVRQRGHFALNTMPETKPENARFLMCVNSSSAHSNDQPLLKNTVKLKEVLQSVDLSKSEISELISDLVNRLFSNEDQETIDKLSDIFFEDSIIINHLPFFLDLDPDSGVSLRNFHIQVAKLALCSDFVVYCFHEDHSSGNCKCVHVARILWLAQMYNGYEDGLEIAKYNVFIPDDIKFIENILMKGTEYQNQKDLFTDIPYNSNLSTSLEASKRTHLNLKLDSFKSNTLSIWDSDYQAKEKIETTKMSSATKINMNVWVGNVWDYQIMQMHLQNEHLHITIDNTDNVKDFYCDPRNSILTKENIDSNDVFSYLPLPKSNWRLFVHCRNDVSFPDLSTLSSLLFKFTISSHHSVDQEFHFLEFPSSGSIGLGDCRRDTLISIMNTCKLLYLFSSSTSSDSDVASSLIYCSDGYTELSLLVLCYLMYSKNIKLDEAMLELHLNYGRPFYIFNSDVTILRKLEVILNKFSPLALNNQINWQELENLTNKELNDLFLSPKLSTTRNQPIAESLKLGYIVNDSDSDSSFDSGDDEDLDADLCTQADWVKDVEGSIPSKILPYLYLGSLKHANSLPLLTKLGISKIISVGEDLNWLNGYKFQSSNDVTIEEFDNGNMEMYNIVPSGNSPKACSVDTVMKVNNLQDDGIDELAASLPSILKYIDDEYKKSNGNTKILVHCRVGVSRSATVVIAEVMKRLNISLPKAYLYVRVRRLNIIVQPNLRFMYELFKWEENEKRKSLLNEEPRIDKMRVQNTLREIDWFVMCREITKLNVPYLVK